MPESPGKRGGAGTDPGGLMAEALTCIYLEKVRKDWEEVEKYKPFWISQIHKTYLIGNHDVTQEAERQYS